ncbi:MAG TPA: carboxypeptidase regulatory-like domain-containing protein [Lysobacter sp.]
MTASALTAGLHPTTTALVLALAAALAMARIGWRQWRAAPAQRSRAWRIAALLLAQPLCAALLFFALWPPIAPGEAGTLVVATAGSTSEQLRALAPGDALVALPEAPTLPDAERVPDLATALRRHPGSRQLRVVGAGLEARDRDAAQGLALAFTPAALPRGVAELEGPHRVAAGARFTVGGRVAGLGEGHAELLDPGRQRVDRVALSPDGRFVLSATARVPGASAFTVRVRDAAQRAVESVEVPLQVEATSPPRVLLLAGAPGPEVKYLRRWARDAGLPLHAQLAVGGGVQLGDAPLALDAATLGRFDVAVLDERAWSSLGDGARAALATAVRNGLGLMLRVTGPLSDAERRRLAALGFVVDAGRDSTAFKLVAREDEAERARIGPGTRDAPRVHDAELDELPSLSRRTLRIAAADGVEWTRDAQALGTWRALGRGRIGVWTLTDSYRLVLAGRSDLHAELWSDALATLARPAAVAPFAIDGEAREGQRVALCGLAAQAQVIAPDDAAVALLRDPATGSRACAAYWPRVSGWHRLQSADRSQLFHVRARGEAPGLRAGEMREATLRLASQPRATATAHGDAPRHPGSRWPWWLACLLASVGLWWLERSRLGRVAT